MRPPRHVGRPITVETAPAGPSRLPRGPPMGYGLAMIRKLLAALLVGVAVAAMARPDEAETTARDMLDAAGREARETLAERCLADPEACLR